MRVAIIDDHVLLLDGLKGMVERNEVVTAVDSYSSAEEFLDSGKEDYDLIITDIDMPGISGTELVSKIREFDKGQKILVLSMHKDEQLIQLMNQLKVNGYLFKDSAPEYLLQAVSTIKEDGSFWPKEVKVMLESSKIDDPILTKREIQIVQLITRGKSNKEIAEECFISETTVKTHRKNIMFKLGLKNTADLVRFAIETKMV